MTHFLFLGNLILSKGILVLLDACGQLARLEREFHCNIVGAGTKELSLASLQKEIAQNGLKEHVTTYGAKYGQEKESFWQQANAFILPTFYGNECFPLVILEAMQHALPVISTPVGAIPDMVDEGVTGLLVPTGDAGALARAMRRLMDAPEAARAMGRAGLARFLERHTTQQFEHNLLRILQDALPSPRRQ